MVWIKLKHGIVKLERSVFIDENMYEYVDADGEACSTPLGDIKVKMDNGSDTFTLADFENTEEGMEKAHALVDWIWDAMRRTDIGKTICVDMDEILKGISAE